LKYIIIALIIGYFVFAGIGIRMGHRPSEVCRMSLDGLMTAGALMAILLAILGVTHAAVPYAVYIYALPLVTLASKIIRHDLNR
jgi:hypothetical protein